jgi:ATP-dependent DNA helicase RecG
MEFKLADIFTDANILKTVSEEVNRMLELDPRLEQEDHLALAERLKVYVNKSYDKLNL